MEDWETRLEKSSREQRKEAEKKYGIKIGQTNIYCVRCGKSCWPGQHVCWDLALKKSRDEKILMASNAKKDKKSKKELLSQLGKGPLIDEIPDFGVKKMSTLLMLPKNTVSKWIQRRNIPTNRVEKVLEILKTKVSI